MTILFIILGVLVLFFLPRRKRTNRSTERDSYADEKNDWSILTSFSELKIWSKYAGELRYGPVFIHIKTEPQNAFGKEFYGDWFFRTENGVYLQKWNSNPIKNGVRAEANNDLVFYDRQKNKINVIETGIKSFHWSMEKDENNELILASNDGRTTSRIKVVNVLDA